MTDWYIFEPVDTLFFKGAEPMVMGANHGASSVFPPSAQTISGAVRTEYLLQHGIDFRDYGEGAVDKQVISDIGRAGEPAPFEIIGPIFNYHKTVFIPVPYSWYAEKERLGEGTIKVHKAKDFGETNLFYSDCCADCLWAKGETTELQSLGGRWMSESLRRTACDGVLYITKKLPDVDADVSRSIVEGSALFDVEYRTGVALHDNRKAREHRLYSFAHYRLKSGVRIMFGISKNLNIKDKGVLSLGGEKRFGYYNKLSNGSPFEKVVGQSFMTLSAIEWNQALNDAIIATGKIQYRGGWDMKKRFHKPMRGYFPAGSVFNKNFGENFLAI
ncbi:MAG: hypothetical protein HQM16_16025 [Deltaproteobacteria bacterium]|nr:hypothetical protein [Deltaproteobacteria bacterium]